MDKKSFGHFIADTRRSKGLSQQQLAEMLHVTNTAVSKWERGLCYPDISLLEKLAHSLDLSLPELMSCQKASNTGMLTPYAEENMVTLLDIANDSKRTQRNRTLLGALLTLVITLILIGSVYLAISCFRVHSIGAVYIGSQIKEKQNYVYMEIQGKFTPLLCEDPQMFNAIVAGRSEQRYIISYRWNTITKKGVLKKYLKDNSFVGTPMDSSETVMDVGSLLGFYGVRQEISNVYPDPNHPYHHIYTLKYYRYYEGTQYDFLTIKNCRDFAFYDYDHDGVVELFIDTKYDDAPYMLYDSIDGNITSSFIEDVPEYVSEWFLKNLPSGSYEQ